MPRTSMTYYKREILTWTELISRYVFSDWFCGFTACVIFCFVWLLNSAFLTPLCEWLSPQFTSFWNLIKDMVSHYPVTYSNLLLRNRNTQAQSECNWITPMLSHSSVLTRTSWEKTICCTTAKVYTNYKMWMNTEQRWEVYNNLWFLCQFHKPTGNHVLHVALGLNKKRRWVT